MPFFSAFRLTTTWCLALCLAMSTLSVHAKRLALVMGNDKYASVSKLQKAGNDAETMYRELTAAGFAVTKHKDLNYRNMVKAIDAFSENITGGDEVVVFYAGHGVQIKAGAYLLPVDIEAENESQVEKTAYSLNDLTDKLAEAKPAFTLVMVDACRSNPMKSKGRAIGNARGLNALEPPKGQMVVYSASKGQEALDRLSDRDTNPNGVFTREFIKRMRAPGVRIEELMRDVQDSVESLAKSVQHEQRPAIYNEARGNFYFYGPTTVQVQQGGDDSEAQTWAAAQAANSVTAYQTYVDAYPKGKYVLAAKIKLDAIKQSSEKSVSGTEADQWAEVKAAGTRESLEAYLAQYPKGKYVVLARAELKKLDDADKAKNAKLALEAQQAEQERRLREATEAAARKVQEERLADEAKKAAEARAESERKAVSISKPGKIIKDCAECPEMVVIPAGSFVMGSNLRPDEQPEHVVRIRSFLMSTTELTQGQWQAVMGSNPSRFHLCGRDCPVDSVGEKDFRQFITRLNQNTGQNYRLPTESEWEYAAKGGTTGSWSFGNEERNIGIHAWYSENSESKTHPVAQKQPNAYGLYDMHGNVREWVEDCWHRDYVGAPVDGSAWTKNCSNSGSTVRGGSWFFGVDFLRSARRSSGDAVNPSNDNGFRLARDIFPEVSTSGGEREVAVVPSKPTSNDADAGSFLDALEALKTVVKNAPETSFWKRQNKPYEARDRFDYIESIDAEKARFSAAPAGVVYGLIRALQTGILRPHCRKGNGIDHECGDFDRHLSIDIDLDRSYKLSKLADDKQIRSDMLANHYMNGWLVDKNLIKAYDLFERDKMRRNTSDYWWTNINSMVQIELKIRGYPIETDGDFGAKSCNALSDVIGKTSCGRVVTRTQLQALIAKKP